MFYKDFIKTIYEEKGLWEEQAIAIQDYNMYMYM